MVRLGFTSCQAKSLCKKLSSVVARCSYAVYQAHNNLAWSHGTDLVVSEGLSEGGVLAQAPAVEVVEVPPISSLQPSCVSVQVLRDHGIKSLFHFTDASNLESIRKCGLMTWKRLTELKIPARMNSSGLSHNLDASKGLADFVRLSFCKKHPMMYVSLKDKRIATPVVLEIKLEAVSRPGVLFCGINAAAKAAKVSPNPGVIRVDVVKAGSQRDVDQSLRPFYQGEVLVPEWIPPHLIRIPNVDAFNRHLELRGRLPDPNLVECTLKGQVEVKASKPSSTSCNFYPIAAGAGPSTPEPHPIEVRSTGDGNGSYETFAPKTLRKLPEVPRFSNLLTELRRERQEKLFSLVGDHTLLRDQFKYRSETIVNWMSSKPPRRERSSDCVWGCERPVTVSASCDDCRNFGALANCPSHMQPCTWASCDNCLRLLCWNHMRACYCAVRGF